MDIDVKNSLEKLLAVCSSIENAKKNNIRERVIEDIFAFVCNISIHESESRFNRFCKVYLNGEYSSADFKSAEYDKLPRTLEDFDAYDIETGLKDRVRTASALVLFFKNLGSYFMTNNMDRKDINVSAYTEILKLMSERLSKDSDKQKKKETSLESNGCTEKSTSKGTCSEDAEDTETLDELLVQLNSLIGLDGVKAEVEQIINLIKVQKKGEEFGEKRPPLSLHLVFYGNPGTGKTTVARLIAKIYRCLGVLSKGQFVEVDRSGLVAGFVGQTATKTQEAIEKAMGGVLFIDEAYSLTHGKGENDFGQEAVDTILKAMEDHRDDFIVIVAGYPDLMKEFIVSNPGLKSRFNTFINFEDYSADELMSIFRMQCDERNLKISNDCEILLGEYFEEMYSNRGEDYANGRDVRNFFENVFKARANRIADKLDGITREEYFTITGDDIKASLEANNDFKKKDDSFN